MTRIATHSKIVEFHKAIATAHKEIKDFYRFNVVELQGKLRAGIQTPVLMLESHSLGFRKSPNKVSTFADRNISFLLLDFAGKVDNYDKQEDVLDYLENVSLDITAFLEKCRNDKNHWLYGMIDLETVKVEKVGPLMDNMYGWNVLYTLKNHEPMCYDASKWEWPTP